MILQPIDGRLTPNNCAVILTDYQSRHASAIGSTDRDVLIQNAIKLARNHASAHGLEIRYPQPGLGEEETNGRYGKPKERWWEKWSMVPGRPLRNFQKRPW